MNDTIALVRAGVFGLSDGLVSNLALVMGLVGARADTSSIQLAGVAGLVAGACSMAAGEYVSVASQRELLLAEGRDITSVGPAKGAALVSFLSFGVGAIVPVVPFLFASGTGAAITAVILSALLLTLLGAAIARKSNRSVLFVAGRQVILGLGAMTATVIVGSAVGQ